MTTAERLALTPMPEDGVQVGDTDLEAVFIVLGGAWVVLSGATLTAGAINAALGFAADDVTLTTVDAALATGVKFPSADPHVAGRWWDNAGVLTKSAG